MNDQLHVLGADVEPGFDGYSFFGARAGSAGLVALDIVAAGDEAVAAGEDGGDLAGGAVGKAFLRARLDQPRGEVAERRRLREHDHAIEDALVEEFENTVTEGANRLNRTWRAGSN